MSLIEKSEKKEIPPIPISESLSATKNISTNIQKRKDAVPYR